MFEQYVRPQLFKMLDWQVGLKTDFQHNPGKLGKYYKQYLESEEWNLLLATYADAGYDRTWESLEAICQLFLQTSRWVAAHFGFDYPIDDEQKVSAHLKHVRALPRGAKEMY
jgi:aminoglycoside 6-adenylyltransferase